jgi:protein-L-isoaspartate(D-aspartate) O-methyltransferase
MDYGELRKRMVEEQLISRGIQNPRLLAAFSKIERHQFTPESLWSSAYADYPLPIGEGQTISQPYIVALMTEYLDLNGKERVLEIGTGSGYQAAILSELVKDVYTIERLKSLAEKTKALFDKLGYRNIKIRVGDGSEGWQEEAPFDRIMITAATPNIPYPLISQLKEGGKLILPLEETLGQILTLAVKENDVIKTTPICGCVFVPLLGKHVLR